MNISAKPKVRAQFHPRALAIIELVYKVEEGYTDAGVPVFRGVPDEAWRTLVDKHPKQYNELLAILRQDFPTFCALLEKIFAKKVGHLIPFLFNCGQVIAWNSMAQRIADGKSLFILFLKARQEGISTLITAFHHWQVWRLYDIECTMVGHEKALVHSFIDRLRVFHEELPKLPGVSRELRANSAKARVPKDELYYADMRAKVTTVVSKNVEVRGRSALHNLLSEYAFYDDGESLLGSLLPQLPPIGSEARKQCSVIIETTPNGKNSFYDLWQHAKSGETEWLAVFLPWMVLEDEYSLTPPAGWHMDEESRKLQKRLSHTRKQIDGKEVTTAQMYWREHALYSDYAGDVDRFDMEYPSDDETCFLIRTRSIFKANMRWLQQCVVEAERNAPAAFAKRKMECKGKFLRGTLEYKSFDNPFGGAGSLEQLRLRPGFKPDKNGNLLMWEPPLPDHTYVIGMDSAAGIAERDRSVACVLDVTEGKQVAELVSMDQIELFTDDCVALAYWYNTALLYPEINSIGVVAMKRLKQVWQYPKVGREEKWDEIGVKPNKYGHFTTSENKKIMISFILHLFNQRYLSIASEGLLSELSTFVANGEDEFAADGNAHDDRVMALGLAAMAIRQSPKLLAEMPMQSKTALPTAHEQMISDAPIQTKHHQVPDIVRKQLETRFTFPSNPIRGDLEMIDL